ncbi:MAG: LysM peptidoglycan-binding domain-containing protein [Saprospiraceae bacterium]|nr:LysM peptidoglycan-binding domain-containing protein [Saprospiraceae bacterium]
MKYQYFFFTLLIGFCFNAIGQTSIDHFLYSVTEEDKSLWGICQQHNVSVEEVTSLNQLSNYNIHPGLKIKIPKQTQINNNKKSIQHIISKNDKSLWDICRKYAVIIDTIQKINGLSNNVIKIGEVLSIPIDHLILHTVTKSDKSLWRICKNYGIDLSDLKEFNRKENNIIRSGDRILIPKDWISEQEIANNTSHNSIETLWQQLKKPVFELNLYHSKFPFKEKKEFRIDSNSLKTLNVTHKLGDEDYVKLYQQATQKSSIFYNSPRYKTYNNLYFYSIEEPFMIDLNSLDYHPLSSQTDNNKYNGYTYDFVTVIEVDTTRNSIEILPVFLYRNFFGNVEKYFGEPIKGAFSCCAKPHPLAHYSKTSKKEVIGFSTLINPYILKYTEVKKRFQDKNIIQVDSTILILQLETYDLPTLIDIEEYKNGKKIQGFIRAKRRKKLGY